MPDQIAHYLFAKNVLAAAGEGVRSRICTSSAAFRAGCYGPDPLFNDPSPRRRAEGFEMHRRPGREALERMRRPVQEKMPWAADYAAGFFCHYALDRLCHPDIKALAAQGEIKHVPLEAAYDRELYLRGHRDMPRRIPMSRSALEAAAQMYERVGPGRYAADLEAFWQIRRLMIFGGGTRLAAVPGKFSAKLDGLIPYAEITPAMQRGIEMMDGLMEQSIAPAARQLNACFEAFDRNLPLDSWTDADFSGFQTQV